MKIRPRSEPTGTASRQRGARRRSAARVGLLAVYGIVIATGAIALLEAARPTLAHSGLERPQDVARAVLLAPWNAAVAFARPAPVEEIRIDVQFKYMHQIHEKRAAALRAGVLLPSDADLVPATLWHGSTALPGGLRLRGEQIAGLDGEKWPLRIELDPGAYVFGMRRFSLMDPKTRGFQAERFPHEHLRRLDVLTPRTFFVRVVLNGRSLGTMLLEEHYTKELLEAQDRREGVVVRWDDRAYWDAVARIGGPGTFDSHRVAELQAFKRGRIDRLRPLSRQRATAVGLLRGFHEGTLPAREVFDLERTARYLAVAELWGSASALRWNHLRFYFNPITSRLEPVGTRFNLHTPHPRNGLASLESTIPSRMLADPDLRAAFVAAAHRVADEVLDGDLLDELREREFADLAVLHREYPWQAPFDFDRVERRARLLRALRVPVLARFGAASASAPGAATPLRARVREGDAGASLELVNTLPVEIVVTDVTLQRGDDPPPPTGEVLEVTPAGLS